MDTELQTKRETDNDRQVDRQKDGQGFVCVGICLHLILNEDYFGTKVPLTNSVHVKLFLIFAQSRV